MARLPIRIAGYQPAQSVHTRALHRLADSLPRETVEVALTENITAGGRRADDLLRMTEGDELDIIYFSSSYLAARAPALDMFDRPFRFPDRAAAHALMDGPAAQPLKDNVAQATGFRVLALWDNGIRHISNRVHPIRNPADCTGLRIRTLDNAAHQAFFHRLGFEPCFIDVKDLVRAAADGTIDAQENPLTNILNFGLHRYHRFVSLTAHLFGVALLLVNRQRFEAWPAELRAAFEAAAAEATRAQWRDAAAEDDQCHRRLLAEGMQFVAADEIDRPAFERAAN
jgi:C4-dicarboxylate-binding protein DctP